MDNKSRKAQEGFAALLVVFLVVLATAAYLANALNSNTIKTDRNIRTSSALSEAKAAIIGYAMINANINSVGYLPNPDFGTSTEGSAAGPTGDVDLSLIGKLPWRTLGISALKDGSNECLFYVVSGRFKSNPETLSGLNWDTQGQIDVIDANGNIIATNLAALIISPGQSLDTQNRTVANPNFVQCSGNYDAKNYLDPYNSANAKMGVVNYFVGSANNSLAPNPNNKQFVLADNDYYNDRLLFVTTNEIFHLISRRKDFSTQISALLDDAYFTSVPISTGSKGTGNVDCTALATTNQAFCSNWKDMLLLTQLPSATPITIDGAPTVSCTRVLIFGGQKTAPQVRLTAPNKADPSNYLEGTDLTAFATPISNTSSFNGVSTFNANNPSADVMRCL